MTLRPVPGLVCWATMPIQGTNARKTRPVVVISSERFTQRTGFVHLLAISTNPPPKVDTMELRMKPGSKRLDPQSRIITDMVTTEVAASLGERIGELRSELAADTVRAFSATLADL